MSATTVQVSKPSVSSADAANVSLTGSATTPTSSSSTTAKIQSKPIQWATSTGATVLQHLAAAKEQQKHKSSHINSNDLINSKPTISPATKPATANAKKLAATPTTKNKSNGSSVQSNSASSSPVKPGSSSPKRQADEHGGTDGKPARRKKANRACSHCQKAHLVCADTRPCDRCVKKGLADSCTDGARKKAKYLLDDDELLELKREKERKSAADGQDGSEDMDDSIMDNSRSWHQALAPMTNVDVNANGIHPFVQHTHQGNGPPLHHPVQQQQQQHHQHHLESDVYFSPASTATSGVKNAFGSENASLEYSILSSMLNGIDPSWLSGSPDQAADTADMGNVLNNNIAYSHMGIDSMPWQYAAPVPTAAVQEADASWKNVLSNPDEHAIAPLHHLDASLTTIGGATPDVSTYDALEVPSPKAAMGHSNSAGMEVIKSETRPGDLTASSSELDAMKHRAAAAAAAGLDHKPDAAWRERVKHIYGDITRPFPYTEGYHFLIKYATANLDKADVLRIVRSLAIFRPSLIALQMPLTEDDEIFVERSIQRTSLEFEKLIAFSGTPTVVWRRTCEIVVVGAEFSMLTQWSKDYLMGRYIYEFFDKPSILEYWEKFALHAFENTAQSIMMPIALRTSAGTTTRCAACFSIKRDIFDLPSLIVGNFLPILS